MDSSLLLVKCITLLYLESEVGQGGNSKDFCKEIVESLNIEETSVELSGAGEVIISLRSLIYWIISESEKGEINKNQLMQRLRVATKDNVYLYDAVSNVVKGSESEEVIKTQVINYRKMLKDHLISLEIKKMVRDVYKQINNNVAPEDYRNVVREFHTKLEPFTHNTVDEKHPSIVSSVSISDDIGVSEQLDRAGEETSSKGILKLGYQAINRMTGEQSGARRGEFVLIGALQHNFKTGFTLNLFKHIALYNKPYMRDKEKKPLILHISLENELHLNIMWLYANLKENETGVEVDLKNVDVAEAAKYVREKMGVNGYSVEMLRLDPNQTNHFDLMDILLDYEARGYEIHAVVCDYLNMVDKSSLDRSGPTGTEIRQLFRILRNFCAPRGITFITPHQLSTEAKMLMRQGIDNFVQEVANKGYYDGSRQIDQEVDLEMFIHIEKVKGVGSFLTIARGKHRKIDITPEKDLFTVLPFHPVGGILDDVNGEDLSMKSVGGRSAADGGGDWFDE